MAQLTVRNLEPEIVSALRTRAARKGRSMEAEHRDILAVALRPGRGRTSFKEWLTRMPDAGADRDFARIGRRRRPVRLAYLCRQLVAGANAQGGLDNVSVLLVRDGG